MLQDLTTFVVSSNAITGTVPGALTSLPLSTLLLDCNFFEGTLPSSFKVSWRGTSPKLHGLLVLGLSGGYQFKVSDMGLQGPVPQIFARARHLGVLLAHRQSLAGSIPNLACTFLVLSLRSNAFQALQPHLRFLKNSLIFVHQNKLSCHLPLCETMSLKQSLVALGNRFRLPEEGIPEWITPAEQDSLFWVKQNEGIKLLWQACSAWTVYVLCSFPVRGIAEEFPSPVIVAWLHWTPPANKSDA